MQTNGMLVFPIVKENIMMPSLVRVNDRSIAMQNWNVHDSDDDKRKKYMSDRDNKVKGDERVQRNQS